MITYNGNQVKEIRVGDKYVNAVLVNGYTINRSFVVSTDDVVSFASRSKEVEIFDFDPGFKPRPDKIRVQLTINGADYIKEINYMEKVNFTGSETSLFTPYAACEYDMFYQLRIYVKGYQAVTMMQTKVSRVVVSPLQF